MDKKEEIELRLWDFVEGISSPDEKAAVQRHLDTDPEWQRLFVEIKDVQQLLTQEPEQPSLRFSKNVMEEITRQQIAPAAQSYINKRIIWAIGIFLGTLITAALVYGFRQMNWKDDSLPVKEFKPLTKLENINVDVSSIFTNNLVNGFLLLNIILGLFFLDRFLANKRKKHYSERM
ncbi:zf-HC2 domain-containing protein [Nostoc ellipsosporum NOK]|nr:zf-HC2 domain-containing protein [Nostoc ellipsosporum NOK]